jgi:hypothetical protein
MKDDKVDDANAIVQQIKALQKRDRDGRRAQLIARVRIGELLRKLKEATAHGQWTFVAANSVNAFVMECS